MKRLVFCTAVLVIAASLLTLAYGKPPAQSKIVVSNAREFLEALGSDRIIEMKPGRYNLSEWDLPDERASELRLADGVSWTSGFYDYDRSITITGIKNLTIRSAGGAAPLLLVDPQGGYVLSFANCDNIVIDGITAGHTEGGHCTGGVFRFENSSQISISGTGMYGSGTDGLTLKNVSDMKVVNSRIYECTYYITTVSGGKNISFKNCVFNNNRDEDLVNVSETRGLTFSECEFRDNVGRAMFSIRDATVSVSRSRFIGNKTESPIDGSSGVKFTECVFDKGESAAGGKNDKPGEYVPVEFWGWSKNGKAALTEHDNQCDEDGGSVNSFYIVDIATDKILFNASINTCGLYPEEDAAPKEKAEKIKKREKLEKDLNAKIEAAAKEHGIIKQERELRPFPLAAGDFKYTAEMREKSKKVVVSRNGSEKTIKTFREGEHAHHIVEMEVNVRRVVGYYRSPYESKILVIVETLLGPGFLHGYDYIGCDLEKGFK